MSIVFFIFKAVPVLLFATFIATAAYALFIHQKIGHTPKEPDAPWHRNFGAILTLGMLQILMAIVFIETGRLVGRIAFRAHVREVRESEYRIWVNGRRLSDEEKLRAVGASLSVKGVMAHHSHPEERLQIRIESPGGELRYAVGQDSERSTEWWVFYPAYSKTDEIGRVRTNAFSKILSQSAVPP